MKPTKRYYLILGILFGLLFFCFFTMCIDKYCPQVFGAYKEGYLAGQNSTLNNYTCTEKIDNTFKLIENPKLIIMKTPPQTEFGLTCTNEWRPKINETFIGCVKR